MADEVQHRKMQSSTLWTQQQTTALFYESFQNYQQQKKRKI